MTTKTSWWEDYKKRTSDLKEYLKGKFIKGTVVTSRDIPQVYPSKFDNKQFTKKHRLRRKRLNKISYKSRRKNRM